MLPLLNLFLNPTFYNRFYQPYATYCQLERRNVERQMNPHKEYRHFDPTVQSRAKFAKFVANWLIEDPKEFRRRFVNPRTNQTHYRISEFQPENYGKLWPHMKEVVLQIVENRYNRSPFVWGHIINHHFEWLEHALGGSIVQGFDYYYDTNRNLPGPGIPRLQKIMDKVATKNLRGLEKLIIRTDQLKVPLPPQEVEALREGLLLDSTRRLAGIDNYTPFIAPASPVPLELHDPSRARVLPPKNLIRANSGPFIKIYRESPEQASTQKPDPLFTINTIAKEKDWLKTIAESEDALFAEYDGNYGASRSTPEVQRRLFFENQSKIPGYLGQEVEDPILDKAENSNWNATGPGGHKPEALPEIENLIGPILAIIWALAIILALALSKKRK